MAFEEGHLKVGGRQKGTPNRKAQLLIDICDAAGCDIPRKLLEIVPSLTPDNQAKVYLGLMPYLFPRRKAVEDSNRASPPIGEDSELKQLCSRIETVAGLESGAVSRMVAIGKMTASERIAYLNRLKSNILEEDG